MTDFGVETIHLDLPPLAAALSLLGVERLDAAAVARTLGSVLKYDEDQEVIRAAGLEQLVLKR